MNTFSEAINSVFSDLFEITIIKTEERTVMVILATSIKKKEFSTFIEVEEKMIAHEFYRVQEISAPHGLPPIMSSNEEFSLFKNGGLFTAIVKMLQDDFLAMVRDQIQNKIK